MPMSGMHSDMHGEMGPPPQHMHMNHISRDHMDPRQHHMEQHHMQQHSMPHSIVATGAEYQ
jgi:transcription factor STE12